MTRRFELEWTLLSPRIHISLIFASTSTVTSHLCLLMVLYWYSRQPFGPRVTDKNTLERIYMTGTDPEVKARP